MSDYLHLSLLRRSQVPVNAMPTATPSSLLHLTLTGDLGSGKSSVAKAISETLDMPVFSTGAVQRKMASRLGLDTLALNALALQDKSIDSTIDQHLIDLNVLQEPQIVDSRLAWHFLQNSLDVYLRVDPEVAAIRVFNDSQRRNEPFQGDIPATISLLRNRRELEVIRFREEYGVDILDLKNYQLMVDTSSASVDLVSNVIINTFRHAKKEVVENQVWLDPKNVYPMEHVRLIAHINDTHSSLVSDCEQEYCEPISVLFVSNRFFLWDGHKRLSMHLRRNRKLIPSKIVAHDHDMLPTGVSAGDYVRVALNKSWIFDWEDAHQFRFLTYPF